MSRALRAEEDPYGLTLYHGKALGRELERLVADISVTLLVSGAR